MSKLIIMQGLPASGKSTKAKELLKQNGNFVRLNRDLLREMLHFGKWSGVNEQFTVQAEKELARIFLNNSSSPRGVIIDDTNLGQSHLDMWKYLAEECKATLEVIKMDTTIEECISRDASRKKSVGNHVIIRMARQFKLAGYDMNVPEIICDIDGTLSNAEERVRALKESEKTGKKDWESFFDNVAQDEPRLEVINMIKDYHNQGIRIILVSGRPERTRDDTQRWLKNYGVPYHVLFMRQDHDKRPDDLVKKDILDKYFNKITIRLVIDDRPSVIRMWKAAGLKVQDVGKGEEF